MYSEQKITWQTAPHPPVSMSNGTITLVDVSQPPDKSIITIITTPWGESEDTYFYEGDCQLFTQTLYNPLRTHIYIVKVPMIDPVAGSATFKVLSFAYNGNVMRSPEGYNLLDITHNLPDSAPPGSNINYNFAIANNSTSPVTLRYLLASNKNSFPRTYVASQTECNLPIPPITATNKKCWYDDWIKTPIPTDCADKTIAAGDSLSITGTASISAVGTTEEFVLGVLVYVQNYWGTGKHEYVAPVGYQSGLLKSITITTHVLCLSITTPTASPTTVTQRQTVTLSATVTPVSTTTEEYSVQFMDGTNPLGSPVTTVSKVATYVWDTTTASTGVHNISAKVGTECTSPDSIAVTINPSGPTATCTSITNPTATPANPIVNTMVELASTATPSVTTTQEFAVQFMDGATNIGSPVPTVNKTAKKRWFPSSVGTHNISSKVTDQCVSPDTTPVVVSAVGAIKCTSITTPTANPTTVSIGSNVILTATVTPSSPTTQEFAVQFLYNGTQIVVITTVNKIATFNWTPTTPGTYNIRARVEGQCTSGTVQVVVTGTPTGVTCYSITTPTANPTTVTAGNLVTLSSTVTPSVPTTEEFTVQFIDGVNPITSVTTVDRIATYIWTPTTGGTHYISARVEGQCVSPSSIAVIVTGALPAVGTTGIVLMAAAAIAAAYLVTRK